MKNFYRRGMLIIMFLLAMGLLVIFAISQAQAATPKTYPFLLQKEISGTVSDQDGEPLLGVTVLVKNRQYGTTTNDLGEFIINASPGDTLVFSSIGYKTQEIPIDGNSQLRVLLEEDIAFLNEIQLNGGYYSVTERERTGNISRVTAEEIENQPVLNPLAAIQGRMPGVEVTQATGVPGGGFDIKIRGTNSLRADGNAPLFIIDGVPYPTNPTTDDRVGKASLQTSPLANIDISTISSIEVLKDADATAIYGSRGANGVVLITTKSAKSGEANYRINLQRGVGQVANRIDLLNTEQYLALRREAYENSGTEPSAAGAPDLLTWDQERETDWQEELFGGTAEFTNIQSSLSGGNNQTTYRAGVGFREDETVFPGDFKNRLFSGNINLDHRSKNNKFSANFAGNYSVNRNELPKADLTLAVLTLAPNAPALFNPDGSLNWENSTFSNPLASLEERYRGETNNLVSSANLGYRILPGLKISSRFGYTHINTREDQYTPQSAFDPAVSFNRRESSNNHSRLETWIVEPQLDFNKKWGDFDVSALVGATVQETTNERQVLRATGFNSDELLENIQAAGNTQILFSGNTEYKYRALYGRFHTDYKDKYLLNLTGRRDGSSRFGPGREYASFGAVGAGWIFSAEDFIAKNLPFLSFGKLRFSYGTTGSDQIGDYQFLDLWSATSVSYQGSPGLYPTRLVNRDFGWETNRKLEGGLELGLFDDAVYLSASYYRNRSSNQLIGLPLPGTTGFTSIQYNFPALVENKGWELALSIQNIKGEDFSWATNFNITIPKNTLLEFDNIENSPYSTTYTVGESLSIQKGYLLNGVNPDTGVYEFEDLNEDGFIGFPDDIVDLVDLDPEFYGGFQNSLNFKGFALDFLFQFVKQQGRTYYQTFGLPGLPNNQPLELLDRWQAPGDNATFQKAESGFGSPYFAFQQLLSSSLTYTDASYVRLKNLSLSYNLPEFAGINSRIYFQGQNLFTVTNYKGLDPENAGSNLIPPLRFLSLGLDINF
ncbi:SusC/RagA family TonB-linked outer membrane protein [Gramella sp. BOM4]|nr:SusC/RagA family TonB-linked outer membrane protein [Christiangramia bathymodioli]